MAGFKDWVFNSTSPRLKGALLGVHSWLHSATKYGPVYYAELSRLRENARLDAQGLAQVQLRLLCQFLKDVHRTNSYYRNMLNRRGFGLDEINRDPVGVLLATDLLSKPFLKENLATITSCDVNTCMVASTSGTTGSPMEVPYDHVGYQRGFAYWRRFYDSMGLPASFRNARLSGRVLLGKGKHERVFWVFDWFESRLFMSTYHMTPENLPAYVAKLEAFRPQLVDGYPSALAILARFVEERGVPLGFTPQAVATTAETLTEADRECIERVFACKVYNQYASSEGAPFITECRGGRMHLNTDTGYFEFHDISGSADLKELVVTSFRNIKVPLIRYRVGDTARLDPSDCAPCVCGSGFPTIASVEGRADDLLYSSERGTIGRLDPIYKGLSGIQKSQIIQKGPDNFHILIIPSADCSSATLETLERNFRSRVGQSVQLRIERVDSIPSSANGKFRAVVNQSAKPSRTPIVR